MDIQKILQAATNKGLSAIDTIRSSITPQSIPNPVSAPVRQTLNQFRSESPQPTTPAPVQSKVTDGFKPFGEFKVPTVKQIEMKPETQKLINLKPEIEKIKGEYETPLLQRQAKVIGSIPGRLQKTLDAFIEINPLYRAAQAVYYQDINKLRPDVDKVLSGLDTFNIFNDLFVQPYWDSTKLNIAEGKGQKFDLPTRQAILRGDRPIYLNDVLGNTEQNTNPITYNLIRFADFAPALIDLPTGTAGKTQRFAREVKFIDKAGNFTPNFEKIVADKLGEFEKVIGRALTPEETTIIRKNIAKPTDIENALKQVVPQQLPTVEAVTLDTAEYIKSLTKKQKEAKTAGTPGILDSIKNITKEIDVKFQDFTTPITQAVNKAIKEGAEIAPTKNPIYQIDRVLRSDSIASQYVKDNGFAKTIGQVDNLDEFNQYLIAKTTQELKKLRPNVKTGRNVAQDAQLIKDLDPKYKELANQVYEYNRQILKSAREYGLISEDSYNALLKGRTEYVPINRVFSEIEKMGGTTRAKAVASLSKQSLIQKLEGSEREIANPLESILTNTSKLVSQGERNIAARQIAELVERKLIPGRILKPSESFDSNEVISYLDKGVKKNVFVGRDIARAAKNLNKEPINFLIRLLRVPTRLLQIGAVGLNPTFIVSNLIRDQQTAAIINGKPLKDTILNPVGFGKAFFESYGEGELYDQFIRSGAGFTSFDLQRDTAKTVQQLKDEARPFVKGAKTVTNPAELLRTVEDFISKAETTPRIQIFDQTFQENIAKGMSPADAQILASDAARNATTNFARRGEWGTVLNSVIPFFNATIQGAKALRDAFVKNPTRTTSLFVLTVAGPTAVTTLWNINDPERKKAYDMIPEYEKEANLIIMPPTITYDENGNPFYIRIPKAQGFSQLANPIRKILENSYESNTDAVSGIANDLLSGTTGFELPITEESRRRLTAKYTPQFIKPAVESQTGVNLYTGQRIIPRGLEKLPPQEQVKENTSFTARKIGDYLGVSPLIVENTIRTTTGGLGSQILNLSDRYFARQGGVPQEQIGGTDPFESILNVFYRARGGADVQKIYDQLESIDTEKALLNLKIKDAIIKNDVDAIKALSSNLTKQQFTALENSVSENEFAKTLSPQNRALFNSTNSQLESLRQTYPNLSPAIDNVIALKEQLKEKQKIDTTGFEFKVTQAPKAKKVATAKVKKAKKPKKIKFGTLKLAKVKKPKSIKPLKFKPTKLATPKKLKLPKNIS